MDHSQGQLADTLTDEPVVFMGCTGTEITVIGGLSFVVTLLSAVVVFIVLVSFSASLALIGAVAVLFGGTLVLSWYAMIRLQSIKESRGNHYHAEVFHMYTSEIGIGDSVFNQSIRFGKGRSL